MIRDENEPIVKTRRLLSMLLAMFPWFSAWAGSKPPKPPLILPFAVHKAGTVVTTELRITEHRVYWFDLRLGFKEHDHEDRNRVKKLAGSGGRDKFGKPLDYGLSIPVRLNISAIDSSGERIIYNKEVRKEEMAGYGANLYSKRIDRVELRPGLYRVTIKSLQDIPELAETPVSLGIGYRPLTTPID
ncbi:MAG: hypothetical protein A2140_07360 [Candidatus Muproteobacteria bacterium RBG_16_62_13]|uniref:DUF5625 domain-containing protein n=1 Tax=Candidatus Muproteobacteria bacterium RBG_16_62_13 TaxID=1817756 RepID=A0A1F6T012_9PROT|nr:MAG: hypothetical protein A2140_07360 [Candidatus Muproteobacteria bacterium RBG_16_62_13]